MSATPDFTKSPAFVRELELVPERMREDALQEAWVAHLGGKSPVQALETYRKRERRWERGKAGQIVSRGGDCFAVNENGRATEIAEADEHI